MIIDGSFKKKMVIFLSLQNFSNLPKNLLKKGYLPISKFCRMSIEKS